MSKKPTHNLNKFDYYCMVVLSYIGAWGGLIAILSAVWLSEYRWKLVFTGLFLLFLNMMAEATIKKYKETNP